MIEQLNSIVNMAIELGAYDLHIKTGFPPVVRLADGVRKLNFQPFSPKEMEQLVLQMLDEKKIASFKLRGQVDCSIELDKGLRARGNIFFQRNNLAISLRIIPKNPPSIEKLGFPPDIVDSLMRINRGLILITGPTNAGKSTTAASLLDAFAKKDAIHIITIEDPIEYIFGSYPHSIFSQRQVGEDTPSFYNGLSAALREDPDLIFIGELRDLDTVETALKAAETGHIIIGTLHTANATQSINRVINMFPSHQRDVVRFMLASCLRIIISQLLLPTADRKGRVLAYEVLPMLPSVSNLIRQKKIHEINSILRVGRRSGCIAMVDTIKELLKTGQIKATDIPYEYKEELSKK